MLQFPSHGANHEQLYKNFNLDMPEIVYDLSENVNFLGYPKQIENLWQQLLPKITSYPNPLAEPLRTIIAEKHKVSPECILVGNGGAELLTFYAQLYKGKKVILVHPTFSEYKMTLEAAGAEIVNVTVNDLVNYELPLDEIKCHMKAADCLYLCNPNNPTGALIQKNAILELVEHGESLDCSLLIDEAFMDWTNEKHSAIELVTSHENVTVVRSMTKMYGIAGIRLGYLIGQPDLVSTMRNRLPHWNVNNLAISIGAECLKDEDFRLQSINEHLAIKNEIIHFLKSYHCAVTNSRANFLCFQLQNPEETENFYFHCLKQGIVLRHTNNYEGMNGKWLRIGMKNLKAMDKFKEVLADWHE